MAMKLSRATKWSITALGLLLLLFLGLTIYATTGSTKTKPVVNPNVCEYCGGQLNKNRECTKCIGELGLEKYRAKRESKYWYNSPVVATTIITLLCVLILVHIGLNWRKFAWRKKAEAFYHVNCRKCGRKLRYRESQINRLGKCPMCQKTLHFPQPIAEPRTSIWQKISLRKIWHTVWD